MRLYGQISELVKVIWRKATGFTVTLEPTDATGGDATVSIPDPAGSNRTLVTTDHVQTLTRKTLDGTAPNPITLTGDFAGNPTFTGTPTFNFAPVLPAGSITSAEIANDTIVDADINASAAITLTKLGAGALPTNITVASANIVDGTITSTDIATDTIVNANISSSAAIALSKLATGALPTGITVASANIVDGTITDADISGTAGITLTKLGAGALPTNITVASANIVDGSIVDADISGSAGITLTKLGAGALPTNITVASANLVDETIVNADISPGAAIDLTKLGTGALPTGITVASANIVDGTIVNADISASAAIDPSKLGSGALPTGVTVASANLVDGTIVDADINASAAITLTKLGTGALPTGITVASANIVDGTIVNADISASAAIDATKIHDGSVDNTEFGYLNGVTSNIQTQLNTTSTGLSDHLSDPTDAHDASAISNVPAGNLSATDVQAALNELQTDIDGRQPLDSDLTALAGVSSNGLLARTGAGTAAARTLTAGSSKVTVTNGDGVSGNPTVDVSESNLALNNISGILNPNKGGTGVANTSTLTLGAANITLNTVGLTNVTLPVAGTLATLGGVETFNGAKTFSTTTDFQDNVRFGSNRGVESSSPASSLNIGTGANTTVLNIGTGTDARTINVGTGAGVTTINVGASGDTTTLAGTVVLPATVTLGANTLTRSGAHNLTLTTTGATNVTFPTSGTLATLSNTLNNFAATTSSELASVITDETGSGALVFATSPVLVTPNLGTPSSVTLTNGTGLPIVAGTTGTLSVARGGTGLTALGSALQILRVNAGGTALEYATAGAGDVVGPASSTNNNLALFDGATGKLLKDAGFGVADVARLSTAQDFSAAKSFSGGITNSVNFDSGTLFVDAVNNLVGIGTTTPVAQLETRRSTASFATAIAVSNHINYAAGRGIGIAFRVPLDTPFTTAYTGAFIGATAEGGSGSGNSILRFQTANNQILQQQGQVDNTGAWTLGPSGFGGTHIVNGTLAVIGGGLDVQHTYNTTTGAAANVNVDSGGVYRRSTSALKYKTAIESLDYGLSVVMAQQPIRYKSLCAGDNPEQWHVGFIADWEEARVPELIQKNGEEVEGFSYERQTAILTKAIQEQQVLIQDLQARIAALEGGN